CSNHTPSLHDALPILTANQLTCQIKSGTTSTGNSSTRSTATHLMCSTREPTKPTSRLPPVTSPTSTPLSLPPQKPSITVQGHTCCLGDAPASSTTSLMSWKPVSKNWPKWNPGTRVYQSHRHKATHIAQPHTY